MHYFYYYSKVGSDLYSLLFLLIINISYKLVEEWFSYVKSWYRSSYVINGCS